MNGSGHYAYFSSLEKTIKIALAFYLLVLLTGSVLLLAGVGASWRALRGISDGAFYATILGLITFFVLYAVVSKIHWLGKLHIWLDRRFFGFLEKSNEIIFQAVVRVLASEEQTTAKDLGTNQRYSMIHSVFSKLAENFHLFDELMKSGIFRFWIWYWVLNYGTFTFSFLTLGAFIAMLAGGDPMSRTLFSVCWSAALTHLGMNIVLGNYLTKMTRKVSESIVLTYKPQITSMLRESFVR